MANTFTQLRYHCVFSTKDRTPLIVSKIEKQVWAIVAETANRRGMNALRVGGIENHIHILLDIPKTLAVAEALKQLKGGSSHALNTAGLIPGRFAWQDGYSAFTVIASSIPDVVEYVAKQREHHRRRTFEDESAALLEKSGVEYNERYLLG